MGLKYRKNDHASQDSMWTSYSDLFLGLSIVFLLLYVSASLRQGTDGIRQFIENKQLTQKNEDLKQQLKAYNTLKQDYLKTQASEDEQKAYAMLMDKLDLLKDEAKNEKESLRKQALENEQKEQSLNQYQQMIRNVINSNMIAKSRIKNRDSLLDEQDETIEEQSDEIQSLEKTVSAKRAQVAAGEQKIASLEDKLEEKMTELQSSYKSQKLTKKKFEEQKLALQKRFEDQIDQLRDQTETASNELSQLNKKLAQTSGALSAAKGQLTEAEKAKQQLSSELQGAKALADAKGKALQATQADLAKATDRLNAQKKLANQIKKNFSKAGIEADVDAETGDVVLSFGDQYFDTGKASLKPQMRKILEQAMPLYSQSLFADNKIAEKIQNVEIVGFASPTFKGKFIDPASLKPEDRQAVNYNLDLSYNRARSIFNHVFDKDKMTFDHQERLLPLVKVTGRSFLSHEKNKNFKTTSKGEEFCRVNDCAKLQRVIIKFSLKD